MGDYTVQAARPDQLEAMLELFPRLASFSVPQGRNPRDLWEGDAVLLRQWATQGLDDSIVLVALEQERVLGVAFARFRKEALSQQPGAHLEVLAVAEGAEGRGIGGALLAAIEAAVVEGGALSLTLNVFMNNTKARGLYGKHGYDEELLRCIKRF